MSDKLSALNTDERSKKEVGTQLSSSNIEEENLLNNDVTTQETKIGLTLSQVQTLEKRVENRIFMFNYSGIYQTHFNCILEITMK